MKFSIKTSELKKWLDIVNHATASITTTPILENILINVNFNNIVLTSNNLDMAIEFFLWENIKIESEWSFCVPSKLFTNYITLIDDDWIQIELLNNDCLKIKTSSWILKIKGTEASDFPLIPPIKEETSLYLKWNIIKKSIDKTLFSSAEWNIRPTLAWVYVNIKWNDAIFASTDSFRLSEYKTTLINEVGYNFNWIIPSKTAFQIKNILWNKDEVKIISWENQIAFLSWDIKIYSRLLNGKFPDYNSFFPTSFSTKTEINRIDLIWGLKKINLISRENNYSIKMSISANNWILLETSETQIWEWTINLIWVVEWEDNIIWINSIYILEVLWVIETTHVSISFETPLSPIVITPVKDPENESSKNDKFKHIIMPLKI